MCGRHRFPDQPGHCSGRGSRLRGLAERLRQETQLPVHLAELPITCVAAGSGAWLEELATERKFDQEIVE